MPVVKKKVEVCVCANCGYEWLPRQPIAEVKACPNCASRYWLEGRPKPKWQLKREDFELETDED
jgi:DNA-directed RNA polymerase subunit RPC12/RpoP